MLNKKSKIIINALRLFYLSGPFTFIGVEILTFLQGFMPFLSLTVFKLIIDAASGHSNFAKNTLILSLVWGGAFLMQHLSLIVNETLRQNLNNKTHLRMNNMIMKKTISFHGIQNFESKEYREMERRLDFCSNMFPYFLHCFTDISQYIIQCASVFFIFGNIKFWIPIAIIFSLIPAVLTQKKLAVLDVELETELSQIQIREMYLRRNIIDPRYSKEFRIFNFFSVFSQQYNKIQNKIYNTKKKFELQTLKFNLLGFFPRLVVASAILYYIFLKVIAKQDVFYTVGMLALYLQSVFVFSDAFLQIAGWKTEVDRALQTIKYFFDYMDYKDSIEIPDDGLSVDEEIKEIRFEKVSFSYGDRAVLKDISFEIKLGSVVAIVGENGAGKTTLIKLLLRFYDASSGTIFINGIDIKKYDIHQYRKKISAIFQDFPKFELLLKESILPGNNGYFELSPEEVNILGDYFYKTLPEGLDTMLGTEFGGRELSGGEWQRIAILRGLKKNSAIFVVDEPTASIDPIQEARIYEKIMAHARKITIFITHRLGSIKKADSILVLRNGELIASGSHENLMNSCSYYNELYSNQTNMYK